MKAKDIKRVIFCFFFLGIFSREVGGKIIVKPQVAISEIYDDNITFSKEDRKNDFLTELGLGLGMEYEGKRIRWDLLGKTYHKIYSRYSNYNNTSWDVSFRLDQELSKHSQLKIKNKFNQSYEPRSFEEILGRTTGRYSYYLNEFSSEYNRDISPCLSFSAKYTNEINEIRRKDIPDSYLNKAGLELAYFPEYPFTFLFGVDFSQREFNPGKNAFVRTATVGLKQYLAKQVYWEGKAGGSFIASYDGREYVEPFISGKVVMFSDEKDGYAGTNASFIFIKGCDTKHYQQDIFDSWLISGVFTKRLTKKLVAIINGFYGEGEYVSSRKINVAKGGRIIFVYRFGKNLIGEIGYTYSQLDSSSSNEGYTKNTVILKLTREF